MADAPVIGIDLGTTYSCVSVFQNGRTRIITVDNRSTIASCVVFTGDRQTGNHVGHEAKDKMYMYPPKDAIFDAKRMLGRRYDDPSLAAFKSKWPFSIHESSEHTIKLQVPDLDGQQQLLPPEEVSCMVLEALVDAVEQSLGVRPVEAIITVPAYFKEPQRDATQDAAILAGLTVRRLVNEPTAAAIAYGLEDPKPHERRVLVFDLGGGTFDISLLKMRGNNIATLATAGNDQLGGNDFDQRVLDWLIEELLRDFPHAHIGADAPVVARIRAQIEKAKFAVNKAHGRAEKAIHVLDAVGTFDFRRVLTTEKFNELNEDLFQLCFSGDADGKGGLDELFGKGGVGGEHSKADVHEILTVGGSTNIPRIRQLLQGYFDGRPLNLTMSADEAVARGAAALTTILGSGAYEEGGPCITDVCSHSYGIQLCTGQLDLIIRKNSALPAYVDIDHYTTGDTVSTDVEIQVFQGEYEQCAADSRNTYIDKLMLTDIRQPGGGRMPKLRVMMELDVNSLLNVRAEDITPGSRARPVTAKFMVREGRMPVVDRNARAATNHVERLARKDNFILG